MAKCRAEGIRDKIKGEVLKKHFPGVSETSVLGAYVSSVLFKLARNQLSAVPKENTLDSELVDKLDKYNTERVLSNAGTVISTEKNTALEIVNKLPSRKEENRLVNHTGGAYGADSIWANMLREYGVKNVHYRAKGRGTKRASELAKVDIVVDISEKEDNAGLALNKALGNSVHPENNRNIVQVYNADNVFAVAPISDGKVQGGTGSAVRMAEALNKNVYVLDTNTVAWYKAENGKYIKINELPTFEGNFAAIGTRDIESYYGQKEGKYIGDEKVAAILKLMQETVDKSFTASLVRKPEVVQSTVKNTSVYTPANISIINGKIGVLSKTGKSLGTTVQVTSIDQLVDLATDFNIAVEEHHGREVNDSSVDTLVNMFKELVNVKDFKPVTVKFGPNVEGLGLATGNHTITMTNNADAYKKVFGSPIRVLLHEYVHTITQMEMKNNPNNEIVKKINALYNRVKDNPELANEYGLTDVYEFVAEALSNPRFQAKLDKIGSKHTLVNKIKELFKALLAWRKDKGEVTALDEILDLAVELKKQKLDDSGNSRQAKYKPKEDTILDTKADKTANNLYKWAKECAK